MSKRPLTYIPKYLPAKQKKFCIEYLKDFDATAAAVRAGYAAGYGHKLLMHPQVKKSIAARARAVEAKSVLTAQQCLERMTHLADNADSDKNKIQALKLLMQYHGLFIERREVGGPGEFASLSDEELERELEHARNTRPQGWKDAEPEAEVVN